MTHEQLQQAAEACAREWYTGEGWEIDERVRDLATLIIRHFSPLVGAGSVCIQTSPTEIIPKEDHIVDANKMVEQPQPEVKREWKCEYCGAVYAEYINGCPKCWMGEAGTSSSVRLVEKPQPEVKVERRTVILSEWKDRPNPWFASEVGLTATEICLAVCIIPIPLIRTVGGLWELDFQKSRNALHILDKQEIAAKDAEISRLVQALKQISKGEGRFAVDALTHASNTIEDMKATALTALQRAEAAEAKVETAYRVVDELNSTAESDSRRNEETIADLLDQVAKLERVVEAAKIEANANVPGYASHWRTRDAIAALERKV